MKRKLFGFIMSCAFLFGLSAVSWGAVRPASAPTPANEATEVVCNTTIKWTGTDTTASDDVTYAIYLGTNESAPAYLGSIRTVSFPRPDMPPITTRSSITLPRDRCSFRGKRRAWR